MEQKLKKIFSECLGINMDEVVDSLRYSESPQWDSIAHMSLIAAIEEAFEIMIDAEDVIDMSSFGKSKIIVAKYI